MLELLYYLQDWRRFCELQGLLTGVPPATLSQRLKILERGGMVQRWEISRAPKHVEYKLTDKGQDLVPMLNAIVEWVKRWEAESSGPGRNEGTGRAR